MTMPDHLAVTVEYAECRGAPEPFAGILADYDGSQPRDIAGTRTPHAVELVSPAVEGPASVRWWEVGLPVAALDGLPGEVGSEFILDFGAPGSFRVRLTDLDIDRQAAILITVGGPNAPLLAPRTIRFREFL
jgi:hypothetical protein